MKKLLSFILALILLLLFTGCDTISPKLFEYLLDGSKLRVYFIDVGQGDCTLLESKGEFVLIFNPQNKSGL